MRVELGELRVQSYHSVHEVRRKIHRLLNKIAEDNLLATRISTAISQACKQLVPKASQLSITVTLDSDMSGHMGLNFMFSDNQPMAKGFILPAFFDHVRPQTLLDKRYHCQASLSIPSLKTPSKDFIWKLESIIKEKSRDELIDEIKATNEELKDSLENLRRTRSAKERMESELNIGREIQMSMLPLEFPPFPHRKEIDIYALLHPAREVGGDFYDFFFIDEHHFCFCVGDVSGKGVPSSLFMAVTKTLIKSNAADDLSTASIITKVNDELARDNKSAMFVTLFLCVLDVSSGKLVYTNAGHNPPYIIRETGALERLDTLHGPVVGAIEEMAYQEGSTLLKRNDYILLYTDGVTEAMKPDEELYSEDRLVGFLESVNFDSVESLVNASLQDVKDFENGADQADDITILSIRFQGEMAQVHTFEYKLKNQLPEIARFIEAFTAFGEQHDLGPGIIQKFNLAADDMLNNIISYGYADQEEHEIQVKAEVHHNRVVMIISDDGTPFNPFGRNPPDTSLPLEERQIGGLGIHLVENLMDETEYQRHSGRNVVALTLFK